VLVRQKALPVHEDFSSEPGDYMRKKESRQDTPAAAPEASAGPATKPGASIEAAKPASSAAPEIASPAAGLRPIDALKMEASEPPVERSFAATSPIATRAARPQSGRFPLLAASVAIAAALGAILGSLGHAAIVKFTTAPQIAAAATDTFKLASKEQAQLKEMISRLRGDVAALKTEIEGSTKVANAQFAKLGERIERGEKAQSEPAGKIAKIVETLDRIDRRSAVNTAAAATPAPAATPAAASPPVQVASAAPETTGSIPQEAKQTPPKPAVVEGWLLREVVDGFALIEGVNGRLFEVGPGSNIPGVGRVESIKRQDGQWVVLTPKGLIKG
jgi:hypothetical protein